MPDEVTHTTHTAADPPHSLPPRWSPECETIIAAMEDGVCLLSPDSRVVRANQTFLEMVGLPPEEVVGREWAEVFARAGGRGAGPNLCAAAAGGEGAESAGEEVIGAHGGRRLRSRVSPVRDGAGRAAGFVMIVRDITDVVAHERELARVEQRSRFGELAAGLAHEIKNPLAGIQGAVDILIERRAAHDPERAVLEGVRREVGRIDATVQTLLDRARPRALNVEPTALAEVLQRAVTLARHHADGLAARGGQRVRLAFEPHAEGLVLAIDAAQIEDAVLSLILNAVDAVDGDGEVVVRLKRTGAGAAPPAGPPAEALIEVADTGRGIPADQLARIFTPFFTTHPNGTGLGLPAVRRIAQAHRGRVEVASTVGHGSVFTLRLPMN